jgi:hypothetical protein
MGEWTMVTDATPTSVLQHVAIKVELTFPAGHTTVYERNAAWIKHDEHGWMFAGFDAHAIECSPAYRVIAWKPNAPPPVPDIPS